jgi:DNA-binding MarR family transcriptional regulator
MADQPLVAHDLDITGEINLGAAAMGNTTMTQAATLLKVMQVLADEMDRDLPLTSALVFARVAKAGGEGIDQGRVQDELKMSSSTIGEVHYLKSKPGLGLVDRLMDTTDNHKRILKLSAKGEKLAAKIAALLTK